MFNIDITLGLLPLAGTIAGAFLFGFLLQRRQLAKRQMRINELRKEMVENHAEILQLEKEFVALEKSLKASRTPVRPMKQSQEVRDAAL